MKIYVAAHKDFKQQLEDGYQIISVGGKSLKMDGVIYDNTYDNISHLNNSYCELTALYWIWKNSDQNIVGLNHYRRYFKEKNKIATIEFLKNKMIKYDIIVPSKRNYYICSIKQHYSKAHHIEDIEKLEKIIKKRFPDYLEAFHTIFNGRKLSLYNMFVAKHDVVCDYCDFAFKIINELNNQINTNSYDPYQKRVIGFIAERLFNVWVLKNSAKYKVGYLPTINTEGEPKFKKAISFIKRQWAPCNE